jgi:opacity protein-like surface antigen
MLRKIIVISALFAAPCAAQEMSTEGHGNYSRTIHSHQESWGAGGSVQALWGAKNAPIRLGTSLGPDWQKPSSGPSQWSASFDATLQPGGSSAVTPYAGGSVSANWFSGDNAPSGTKIGFQGILGVQIKPESQSPLAFKIEARPGYVDTQEHSLTVRAGVSFSM